MSAYAQTSDPPVGRGSDLSTSDEHDHYSVNKRVLSAGIAASVSSILCTPLDVVKIRMQTSGGASSCYSNAFNMANPSAPFCMPPAFPSYPHRVPVRLAYKPSKLSPSTPASFLQSIIAKLPVKGRTWYRPRQEEASIICRRACTCTFSPLPSLLLDYQMSQAALKDSKQTMMKTVRSIYRQEGIPVFWRGLDSSLLMSIPMVSIYMPLYDALKGRMVSSAPGCVDLGGFAPAAAGMASRAVAIFAVAPMELVRTRQQALAVAPQASGASAWQVLQGIAACPDGGASAAQDQMKPNSSAVQRMSKMFPRLWSGVWATVARDVPFTAIYWSLLEASREEMKLRMGAQRENGSALHSGQVFTANLMAGAVSGSLAAGVTTPADVIKTRLQTYGGTSSAILRQVWKEEGVAGLMKGWAPRAARAGPACSIVIASYEMLKTLL
eukprot:gene5886-33457_t